MKYLVIQLVACAPLVVLTVWSFADIWRAHDSEKPSQAAAPIDLQKMKGDCNTAETETAKDLLVAEQLGRCRLWDTAPPQIDEPKMPSLCSARANWKRAAAAREVAEKVSSAAAKIKRDMGSVSTPLKKIGIQLDGWKKVLDQQEKDDSAKLPGAKSLLDALQQKVHDLEVEELSLRKKEEVNKAMVVVRAALDAKRDLRVLALIDEEPLKSVSDGETRTQIEMLKRRAQYRIAWRKAFENPQGKLSEQRSEAKQFLKQFPSPPTDDEMDWHEKAEAKLKKLNLDIAFEELGQPTEFETLLGQTEAILQMAEKDPTVKERVRQRVRQWLLETGLPKREKAECLDGRKEAVTKSGERMIGTFYLPTTNALGDVSQWRYWKEERTRDTKPRGELQIDRNGFDESPNTLKYAIWADEYNEARIRLVNEVGGTQVDWTSFVQLCREVQKQLEAYRELWGIKEEVDKQCRSWTFEPQTVVGQQVLSHWTRYRALFDP